MSTRLNYTHADYISASESDEEALEIVGFHRLVPEVSHSSSRRIAGGSIITNNDFNANDLNELIKIKQEVFDIEDDMVYPSSATAPYLKPMASNENGLRFIEDHIVNNLGSFNDSQVNIGTSESLPQALDSLGHLEEELATDHITGGTIFNEEILSIDTHGLGKSRVLVKSQPDSYASESLSQIPESLEDGIAVNQFETISNEGMLKPSSAPASDNCTESLADIVPDSLPLSDEDLPGMEVDRPAGETKISNNIRPSEVSIYDYVNESQEEDIILESPSPHNSEAEDGIAAGQPSGETIFNKDIRPGASGSQIIHQNIDIPESLPLLEAIAENQQVASPLLNPQVLDYNAEAAPNRHLRPRTSKQKYPYSFDYYKYKSLGMAGVVAHSWRANREGYHNDGIEVNGKSTSNGMDIDLVFSESPNLSAGAVSQVNQDDADHQSYRYKRNIVSSDDDSEYSLSGLRGAGEGYQSSEPDSSDFDASDGNDDDDDNDDDDMGTTNRSVTVSSSPLIRDSHQIDDIAPSRHEDHQSRMNRLLRGILPTSYLTLAKQRSKAPARPKKRKPTSTLQPDLHTRGKAIRKVGVNGVGKNSNDFQTGDPIQPTSLREEPYSLSPEPFISTPQEDYSPYKPSKKIYDFFEYRSRGETENSTGSARVEDKIDRMFSLPQPMRIRSLKKNDTTKSQSKVYRNSRVPRPVKTYTTRMRRRQPVVYASAPSYHRSSDKRQSTLLPQRQRSAVTISTAVPRAYNPVKYISFGSRRDDLNVLRRNEGLSSEMGRLESMFLGDSPQKGTVGGGSRKRNNNSNPFSGPSSKARVVLTPESPPKRTRQKRIKNNGILAIVPSMHKPVNRVRIRPGNLEIESNKYAIRPAKKIRQPKLRVTATAHMPPPLLAPQESFLSDEQRYQAIAEAQNQNPNFNTNMTERISKCFEYLTSRKKSNPSVYVEDNSFDEYDDTDTPDVEVRSHHETQDYRGNFYENSTLADLERIRHLPRSYRNVLKTMFGDRTIDYLLSTAGHAQSPSPDMHMAISPASIGELIANYKADIEYWNAPHRLATEYGELQDLHLRDLRLVTDIMRNSFTNSESTDNLTSIMSNIVSFTSFLIATMVKEMHSITSQSNGILSRMIIQGLGFCLVWLCLLCDRAISVTANGISLVVRGKFAELTASVLNFLTKYSVDNIVKHLSYDRVKDDEWGLEKVNGESPYVTLLYTAIFVNTFDFELGSRNVNKFWQLPIFLQSDIAVRDGDNLARLVFCCLPLLSLETSYDSDLANWALIRSCMNAFFENYDSNYSSDSFLKAWLLRCNILITEWDWPASVIVTYFYDFFSRKSFCDFDKTQTYFEVPNFLQNPGWVAIVNDRDPVFHTFLMIVASAVTDVKLPRGSLSRLIGRLTPVLREIKNSETRVKSLSNKYALLLTLFWYAPYNRGPSIYQIRDTIDTASASIGECLQSLKALKLLALFVLRKSLSINDIMKWFDDIVSRFIFEFSSQSHEVKETSRSFYEDLFTSVLDTFDYILERIKDMKDSLGSSVWNDSVSRSLSLCLTRSNGFPLGSVLRLLESFEKFLALVIDFSGLVPLESSETDYYLADIVIDGYYGMMSTYMDDELAYSDAILEHTIKVWADVAYYLVKYRNEHWDTFLNISPKYSWVNFESSVKGRRLKPLWLYHVICVEPDCYSNDKFLFMEYFIEYITVYDCKYEGIFLIEMLPNFSDILTDDLISNRNKLQNRDLFFSVRIEIIEAIADYLELQSLYDSVAERRAVRLLNKLKSCLERNLRHIENAGNRTKYFEFTRSVINFLSTSRLSQKFDQMDQVNSIFYKEKTSESEILFVNQLKRMIKYVNTSEGQQNILYLLLDSFSASLLSDSGVSFTENMIRILANDDGNSLFIPRLCQPLISYFINKFALWFTQFSVQRGYKFGFLSVIFDILYGYIYHGSAVYEYEFTGINRLFALGFSLINSVLLTGMRLDNYQKSFVCSYFKLYLLLLKGADVKLNVLNKVSLVLITNLPLLLDLIYDHGQVLSRQATVASVNIDDHINATIPKEIVDFHSKYTYLDGSWFWSSNNHQIDSTFETKDGGVEALRDNMLGFFQKSLLNKAIVNQLGSDDAILSLVQAVAIHGGPGFENWVLNTTGIADKLERHHPSTVDDFIF